MSERDDELDRLLEPLKNAQLSPGQVARWQALAKRKTRASVISREWGTRALQMTAAAFIGFVLGALVFKNRQEFQQVASNFDSTATIESVYLKSN